MHKKSVYCYVYTIVQYKTIENIENCHEQHKVVSQILQHNLKILFHL